MKNTKWNPCHLYPFQPPLPPLEKWLTNGWCIFCNSFLLLSRSIVYWKKNQTKGQKQHHQTCPCLSFSRMCRCYQCLELFQLIQKGPKAIHVYISACKYTKHYPLFSINHVVQVFHVQISTVTTPTIIAYFLPNTVQVSPIVTPYRMSPLHQRVYQALPQTEWSVTHLFCFSKLLTFIDKLWLSSVQAFTLSSSPSM